MKHKTLKQAKSQPLADTLAEARAVTAGQKAVDKRVTLFHAKDAEGGGSGSSVGAIGGLKTPTDEQLARINTFTLSPKTADQVAVFETLSANTLPDRDDDFFTEETIREFAALPEPYGPTGKSYMTGHDYSGMPVARIFGTGVRDDVTDAEGKAIDATFLTNEVYIPRTPENEALINSIDFGINWAVSVGVMLDAMNCSICSKTMHTMWGWSVCDEGHVKGSYYDPNSDETDSYGYPMERQPSDKGVVKAMGKMEGAKDFYELSQVFLGAQFYASLDKGAGIDGVIKAASASKAPLLGLSSQEASAFKMPHTPDEVRAALAKGATREEDGALKWVDDRSLVWRFAPGDNEPLCLGKEASDEDDEDLDNEALEATEEVDADGEAQRGGPEDGGSESLGADEQGGSEDDAVGGAGDDSDGEDPAVDGGPDSEVTDAADAAEDASTEGDEPSDEDEDTTDKPDAQEGVKTVSRKTVLAAATAAKVPAEWIAAAAGGEDGDNGLLAILTAASESNSTLAKQVSDLTPKAEMGDEYIKSLQAEAIDWYVKSHTDGTDKGVPVDSFQKILEACGDNVELVKTLIDENKNLARAKFPRAVRRSSAQSDPHEKTVGTIPDGVEQHTKASDTRVRRLHG